MTKKPLSVSDRLNGKLKAQPSPDFLQSPCLVFQGRTLPSGHGQFWYKSKPHLAHRVAWEAVHGDIPTDPRSGQPFVISHLCDNPPCCNVDHMQLGSQQENIQDCIAKGRHASQSAILNKLNRAVELSETGMTKDGIAEELKVTPDEVERLLDFHARDADIYAAEQITLSHEAAEQNRRHRLANDYEAVIATVETLNTSRHIRQLDLCV